MYNCHLPAHSSHNNAQMIFVIGSSLSVYVQLNGHNFPLQKNKLNISLFTIKCQWNRITRVIPQPQKVNKLSVCKPILLNEAISVKYC